MTTPRQGRHSSNRPVSFAGTGGDYAGEGEGESKSTSASTTGTAGGDQDYVALIQDEDSSGSSNGISTEAPAADYMNGGNYNYHYPQQQGRNAVQSRWQPQTKSTLPPVHGPYTRGPAEPSTEMDLNQTFARKGGDGRLPLCFQQKDLGRRCQWDKQYPVGKGFEDRHWYNATSNNCTIIFYKGCGGNDNNFKDGDDCQRICAFGDTGLVHKKDYYATTSLPGGGGDSQLVEGKPPMCYAPRPSKDRSENAWISFSCANDGRFKHCFYSDFDVQC